MKSNDFSSRSDDDLRALVASARAELLMREVRRLSGVGPFPEHGSPAAVFAECARDIWPVSDAEFEAAVSNSAAADIVRLGIGLPHEGNIEIFSVATNTTLLLPVTDLRLLKDGLASLDLPCSSQRIVDLDPSS